MPEAITSPSEKLVPIDTSGNAVDVTLKEDKEKGVDEVTKEDSPRRVGRIQCGIKKKN